MPILTVNTNLFARLFCSFLLLRVSAGGEDKEKSFRFARTNLCSLSPRLVPQNWSRDCGDFYESNKHDIWQPSNNRVSQPANTQKEHYLKFTFHSWMCKQALLAPKIATTSSITSKRFWRNEKICTYHLELFSRFSLVLELISPRFFFLCHKISFYMLAWRRAVCCASRN